LTSMTKPYRVVAIITIVMLLACSSRVPVTRNEAVKEKDPKRYVLHLRSGEELITKRIAIDDSIITVYSIVVEGKEVDQQPPRVVDWNEVEKLERSEFDDAETIALILVIGGIVFLLVEASGISFGAD
jgi:hypothetical protein